MIKRDMIQRVALILWSDGTAGKKVQQNKLEKIPASVSVYTSNSDINQYGVKEEYVLHVVTNKPLDEGKNIRYIWKEKLFQLLKQIKSGNEWFSTLKETKN